MADVHAEVKVPLRDEAGDGPDPTPELLERGRLHDEPELLLELARGRLAGRFALVDQARRELPHVPLRDPEPLAQEDRHPITEILQQTPEIPATCQWAIFLRNHDELTLEMVTDVERDYMYDEYARDKAARINMGIRRRLAPLMDNDRRRIELLNGLLMSLPGTPIVYYGDEIGMGDNVYLGDRNGVRTPMQWNGHWNGGFSTADPEQLYSPLISNPLYGYQAINVDSQLRSEHSLLSWMRKMIQVRKSSPVFSRGSIEFLQPTNHRALAYIREFGKERVLVVNNLANTAQAVELDLRKYKGSIPIEMSGKTIFPRIGELPYLLTMGPYQFYWFRLRRI